MKIIPILKRTFVLSIFMMFIISCQKDDTVKTENDFQLTTERKQKIVKASDIPKVMEFLKTKTNNQLTFELGILSENGMDNRQTEPDLIITEAETENIIALTSAAGITNYSFKLHLDNAPVFQDEISFFNLIVKEINTNEEFYGYIQEYRMDKTWYRNNGLDFNLNSYSGKILFYDLEGNFIAKANYSSGNLLEQYFKNSCDQNGGGGGSGGDPSGGGSGGSSGGGSGGSGGTNCYLSISHEEVGCTCSPGDTGGCSGPTVITIITINCISYKTLIDSCCEPPCQSPPECFDIYQDPCPLGCNEDGTCFEENEEIPINGPTFNILLIIGLNNYLTESITVEQQMWMHANQPNHDISWEVHDNLVNNPNDGQYNFSILATERKITTDLNDCTEHLMNDILGLQQTNFKEILKQFGSFITPYSWDVSHGNPSGNNVAETNWGRDVNNDAIPFQYETIINQYGYTNQATEIAIMRTLLHELLHAYLLSVIDDGDFLQNNGYEDFPLLWEALLNQEYNNNPEFIHHQIFSEHFINPIKEALKEWDYATQSDQYYEDLAWGALMGNPNNPTASFDVLFPPGSQNRDRIINTNNAEDTNTTQGSISPQGNPCI